MQRRKSARNQKPEPTPAQEPPAPAKEAAKSKRKDTPVKEKPAEIPPAPLPPPPLPIKLATGQPIPTVKEPQPAGLPESDWQSVVESGVLKAALERSRQKWMTPGIFELYYSKAGKKKLPNKGKNKDKDEDKGKDRDNKEKAKDGGGDGAKDKESSETLKAKQMKREGNCKLYIDPHQWDITIWTMRENTVPPPPKPKPAPPPPSYYGTPHPYQHYHPYPPQHPPPPPMRKPLPPAAPNPPPPPSRPAQTPESNPAASKPAPDPVIHMLAERANTNFKLRDIMKIVARGDATKEQLEYFQSHINELTERLEAQKKAQAQQPPAPRPPPPPARASSATSSVQASPRPASAQGSQASPAIQSSPAPQPLEASPAPQPPAAPSAQGTPRPLSASSAPPASAPAAVGASHSIPPPGPATLTPAKMPQQPPMTYYTPPAPQGPYSHFGPPAAPPPPPPPQPVQPAAPPPPPQPPQPTYRALCIDFNTNGDRLLFPRETILEALPGNQVLASFLKVHKVDAASLLAQQLPKGQTYYAPGKEYYQPVTVRFRANNPADSSSTSVLQCLFRWVRPQDEVRKYMEEVMDRAEPAEEVELAARLPREGVVQEETSMVLGEQGIGGGGGTGAGVVSGKAKEATGVVKESVERVGTPVGERDRKRKRVR